MGELFVLPRYQSTVFILLGGLEKGVYQNQEAQRTGTAHHPKIS
jgi:hypothetical protein